MSWIRSSSTSMNALVNLWPSSHVISINISAPKPKQFDSNNNNKSISLSVYHIKISVDQIQTWINGNYLQGITLAKSIWIISSASRMAPKTPKNSIIKMIRYISKKNKSSLWMKLERNFNFMSLQPHFGLG